MTNVDLVTRKLGVLTEHIRRSEVRLARPRAELADVDRQDALAMGLLVAIQEALDVAFHICADEGWGIPASNPSSFEMLAEHGVLDASVANEMGQVTRLRNRIGHGYASLDMNRLLEEAPAGLEALKRFAAAVSRWIG